jgi:hypothetical protein
MNIINTSKNFGYFPEIFLVANTQRLERLNEYHLNISGENPTFLAHGLGCIFIGINNLNTLKMFGYFPEILNVTETQSKGMLIESYYHLNISGKYPKFLAHGLEYFVILNAHFLGTQIFWVFLRNIHGGRHTIIANVS